jgi:hypothetical protein
VRHRSVITVLLLACAQASRQPRPAPPPEPAEDAAVPTDGMSPARDRGIPEAPGEVRVPDAAAAPVDAAAPDAALPTDAADSRPDAAPGGGCAGLFCEDFESGALDPLVWTRKELTPGNAVTVQTTTVAHGAHAAQFHARGGSTLAMIFAEHLPPALQQHYFGRLSFQATGFPGESGGHSAYVLSHASLAGFPWADHHLEVGSYLQPAGPIWQLTYWTGDGPEYIGAGGQIPRGRWFCLEWEFNDQPDQIAVWVDGDAMTGGYAFRNIRGASGLLGKLGTLGVGFRTWHPMGAPDIDVYIDDIVLDSKRVGCR